MMPGKDGFELCKTLKNDFRTSHIPIIILTAMADMSSKITGLEQGADAYLTKPFNRLELQVRLQKLIELRENLKAKFRLLTMSSTPIDKPTNQEEIFIDRLKQILQENSGDENFDTNQLGHLMGISRVQLFRKLKALTGQSASQVIRSFRLSKAKDMILSTQFNISEIAFEVGFKDPAYFTRVFTKEFGFAPSSLRSTRTL
jgi:YesN/AraC family two-component response regulator